jgi:Sec-independent protein translocase protein TatA
MKPGVCFVMVLLITGMAWAGMSKDEKNLEREEKRINDTAAKPDGEKAVVKRLVEELKASEQQIKALRDRKLDHGEIAVILSLAQTMPGGTTDANVQKVLDLRQGPPAAGWDDVAHMLGTKLGRIVSQVRKVANNANREIKKEHARADRPPETVQPQQPVQQSPAKPDTYSGEGHSLPQGGSAR